jgi:primosomal protein N''
LTKFAVLKDQVT